MNWSLLKSTVLFAELVNALCVDFADVEIEMTPTVETHLNKFFTKRIYLCVPHSL